MTQTFPATSATAMPTPSAIIAQPEVILMLDIEILAASSERAVVSQADRKSVVEGKSVSVRVDDGGRRIIKKKHTMCVSSESEPTEHQYVINKRQPPRNPNN